MDLGLPFLSSPQAVIPLSGERKAGHQCSHVLVEPRSMA